MNDPRFHSCLPSLSVVLCAMALSSIGTLDSTFAAESNTAPVVTLTSPANGARFGVPATVTLSATASDPGDTITQVSFYADGKLLQVFTNSPYRLVCADMAPGLHHVVAMATDSFGAVGRTPVVGFEVTNSLPVVTLTSPVNGAVLPANVLLTAAVTDTDDAISQVSFYTGNRLLGVVTNSPYTLVWSNAPSGRRQVSARAVDSYGAEGSSPVVQFTVTNALPVVSLVSPVAGQVVGPNVTLTATASDTDSAVAKVAFYTGSDLIGILTNSPYSLVWSNVSPGLHQVWVRAFDAFGAEGRSAPVEFTVTNTPATLAGIAGPDASTATGRNSSGVTDRASTPPPILEYITALPDGSAQLTITGPVGGQILIEESGNFADWLQLTVVTNTTGTVDYVDRQASSHRYYRVSPPQ